MCVRRKQKKSDVRDHTVPCVPITKSENHSGNHSSSDFVLRNQFRIPRWINYDFRSKFWNEYRSKLNCNRFVLVKLKVRHNFRVGFDRWGSFSSPNFVCTCKKSNSPVNSKWHRKRDFHSLAPHTFEKSFALFFGFSICFLRAN